MEKFGLGDVVKMGEPTIGAGPPGNKAIVVGFLVTHPETNEVWMAWPDEKEDLEHTTAPESLSPEVIETVLKTARAKFYKCMANAGKFVGDIVDMLRSDG
jgi:hypothetical protein